MRTLACIALLAVMTGTNAQASELGYIIKLKQRLTMTSLSALNQLGVGVKNTIPELNLVVTDTAPEGLFANPDFVEYVAINHKIFATAVQPDVYQKEADALWGMKAIKAAGAWRLSIGDKAVIAAVSDTGVYQDHADLLPNLWLNRGESGKDLNGNDRAKNGIDDDGNGFVDDSRGWNFENNTSSPADDHYHGTHVSGTVGARGADNNGVAGVSWLSTIMPLKFIGSSGWGSDEGAIGTIVYAANNGAKVLNASWGDLFFAQPIYDAIEYAKTKGMLIVAAAGNDGVDTDVKPHYPSAMDNENVISVAATSGEKGELAGFSNWGRKTVDIAAPGDHIYSSFNVQYSTGICGNSRQNWYCHLSGTSMAAPHVTGAIALIYSVNPKLNFRQVKEILMTTVTKVPGLEGKVVSGGVLNVEAAVAKAISLRDGKPFRLPVTFRKPSFFPGLPALPTFRF
ncbi:MAG: S8 family peptidase [Bdellovibrionia bacterium]